MGYFFTLLYLLTAYITPAVLFGPLGAYHIEIIIALLAIVTSIPNLSEAGLGRAPQTIAIGGLAFAIAASIAQTGWLGGIAGPLYGFTQPAFAFFLVAINFRRKSHFTWLVILLIAASAFFMVMGIRDLNNGVVPSPYLYGDGTLRRLRGLGFVNDPNDFSQVLVALVPCVFLWRKKVLLLDVLLLGVPLAILLTGMYFTHSRGAMLAFTVVILLSARRKIGIVPAAIIAGGLALSLFAFGWSGGRDISMDAGADRLDLWYDGMQSLKARPLFGIGLDQFSGVYGITAHNSVIICAAELGAVGLFFWVLFLFSTVRSAIRSGAQPVATAGPAVGDDPDFNPQLETAELHNSSGQEGMQLSPSNEVSEPQESSSAQIGSTWWHDDLDIAPDNSITEMRGVASILLISLAGMLTAGWFLSRALSMWLFMFCGMIYASIRLQGAGESAPKDKMSYLLRNSALVTVSLIGALYLILRARNIF